MTQIALKPTPPVSDAELVQRCIANEPDAWSELVVTCREHIRWAITRAGRSHGVRFSEYDVEDIESSLFLGLMVDDARRLRNFQGHATLRGWLRVVAANLAIDRARSHHRAARRAAAPALHDDHEGQQQLLDSLPDPNADIEAQLQQRQLHERLHALFAMLSPEDQNFTDLFFIQQLGYATIARLTGVSEEALYTRRNRIRKKLIQLAQRDGWFDHKPERTHD
jgi:RNA polymerase sigma factor (sigma-70 family)